MSEDRAVPDLAQWLRALAAEVEQDPALAVRVQQRVAAPPQPSAVPEVVTAPPQAAEPPPSSIMEVATEVVQTPAAALTHRRRSTRFGPPTVAGRGADLGQGVPDPLALLAERGAEGLAAALADLRIGTLRAIIRTHQLDPDGKLPASATEKRLITTIVTAAQRQARLSAPSTAARASRQSLPRSPRTSPKSV